MTDRRSIREAFSPEEWKEAVPWIRRAVEVSSRDEASRLAGEVLPHPPHCRAVVAMVIVRARLLSSGHCNELLSSVHDWVQDREILDPILDEEDLGLPGLRTKLFLLARSVLES